MKNTALTLLGENVALNSLANLLKDSVNYIRETQAIPLEDYTDEVRLERADKYAEMMADGYQNFLKLDHSQQDALFSYLALEIDATQLAYIQRIFHESDYRKQVLGIHFFENSMPMAGASIGDIDRTTIEIQKRLLVEKITSPFSPQGTTPLEQVSDLVMWITNIQDRYRDLSNEEKEILSSSNMNEIYESTKAGIFERASEEALAELKTILEQPNFVHVDTGINNWFKKYEKYMANAEYTGEQFFDDTRPISDIISTSKWAWAFFLKNEKQSSSKLIKAFSSYAEILPCQAPSPEETPYISNDWLVISVAYQSHYQRQASLETKNFQEMIQSLNKEGIKTAREDKNNFRFKIFVDQMLEELERRFNQVQGDQVYFYIVPQHNEPLQTGNQYFLISPRETRRNEHIFCHRIIVLPHTLLPEKAGYYSKTPTPNGWFNGDKWDTSNPSDYKP